jgi:two-component system cell cycle response regulator DivK
VEGAVKKILIIEDMEINIDLLVQILEDDYELVVARNGVEGLKKAAEEKPDLILMDMALPVMDGWETTRRIKSDEAVKHIPIIGISSHAMSGDAEKAKEAGCDDYLTKPLDDELLFQKLAKFLGR